MRPAARGIAVTPIVLPGFRTRNGSETAQIGWRNHGSHQCDRLLGYSCRLRVDLIAFILSQDFEARHFKKIEIFFPKLRREGRTCRFAIEAVRPEFTLQPTASTGGRLYATS